MRLDPAFVADCPYGPGGLLIDDIVRIDRDASVVVATHAELPLTREQRNHRELHPQHIAAGLMIGMVVYAGEQTALFSRVATPGGA